MVYAWHGGVRLPVIFRAIRSWQAVQLFGGTLLCLLALSQRLQGHACTPAHVALGLLADAVPAALFQLYWQLFMIEVREFESGKFAKRS